jgi:hypothetical protein
MDEKICISKNYFFILLILFVSLTILHIYFLKGIYNEKPKEIKYPVKTIDEPVVENKPIETKPLYIESPSSIVPLKRYLENRDRSIMNDRFVAPERRYPYTGDISPLVQIPNDTINEYGITSTPLLSPLLPIVNIPTRGLPDNYQLLGILLRDKDENIQQLFGRPTFPGSNQFEYYIVTERNGFTNKIPIETRGSREINDQDEIDTPIGKYRVKLYNYNTPRYNPYV